LPAALVRKEVHVSMDTYDYIVGTRVLTSDGHELGEVKELVGRYFKVAAPMAPDYWLPNDLVASASQSELRLNITRDEVTTHEVPSGEIEAERASQEVPRSEEDMAVEAAAIVWGADEWAVVRSRILETEPDYTEAELDRMQEENPTGMRERFGHLLDDADRSSERLARTVEENT
jgi:hypothetical protein